MTGDKRFGEEAKQSLFTHQFGGRKSSMLMGEIKGVKRLLGATDKQK